VHRPHAWGQRLSYATKAPRHKSVHEPP
jgi:hypothetical protein